MLTVISWLITVLTVAVTVSFLVYLFFIRRLPDERPEVATYDRYGNLIGRSTNPGEQIGPGRSGDPARPLRSGRQSEENN